MTLIVVPNLSSRTIHTNTWDLCERNYFVTSSYLDPERYILLESHDIHVYWGKVKEKIYSYPL